MSAAVIEACEAWPAGVYVLCAVGGEPKSIEAVPAITRRTTPGGLWPANFDPVGTLKRGAFVHDGQNVAERLGPALFLRMWLDVARAAFPGVRWRVDALVYTWHDGSTHHAAYGCLDGRVVAMIAEVLP